MTMNLLFQPKISAEEVCCFSDLEKDPPGLEAREVDQYIGKSKSASTYIYLIMFGIYGGTGANLSDCIYMYTCNSDT